MPQKRISKDGEVRLLFEHLQLLPGKYRVDATIEKVSGDTVDYFDNVVSFEVGGNRRCSGVAWLEHKWEL